MADYKIQLGIDLKVNDIRDRITQYNQNKNNAKLKLGVKLDTADLKRQISQLNLGGTSGGKGVAIPVNTQSLETSLKEVKTIIADIKTSIGSLDSGAGTKSLLSSINQISGALDKASAKFDELNAELKTLSAKDFNINIGIDMGKKGLNTIGYGRAARKQVIPELESQIKYLENLFGGQQATMNRLASKGKNVGFDVFTDFADFNSDTAIKKMEAMEKYINSLKKLAAIDNISLDGFNEAHKDATELINDITGIESAVDKAGDVPEKLKNLFGSGVDGENLSKQLDSIVTDLGEIKTVLQGLSSGVSLEGLTASFDKLSDSIELLVQNATQAKNVLGDGLNATASDGGTERAIQEQKEFAQVSTQAADAVAKSGDKIQQAYGQISKGASTVGQLDTLNLKDDISEADRLSAALSKLKNIQGNIKKIEVGELDTSKGVQELRTLESQLESLSAEYNETVAEINAMGGVSGTQWQSVQNQIRNTELRLEQLKAELAEKITTSIGTTITKDINKANSDFNKLANQSDDLRQKLQSLDDIKIDAITAAEEGDVESLVASYKELLKTLKEVQTQLDINKRIEGDANNANDFNIAKEKALLRVQNLFGENSEAARRFASDLDRIQKELNECGDSAGLKKLNGQMDILEKKASATDLKTQTFGQKFKKQWQQYTSYLSVASVFMYAGQAMRSMFEQVKSIDTAMTELKKVTDESDASYNQFLSNAASRARELGTTIDGLVTSTSDFARLGYGFKDAQGLAEVANIYAVVGDEVEGVEGATESLISTMAAFKDEMNGMSDSDFAMSIVDKFNEIGNNFAISSGGIGEALTRSASSLAAANNTLDESIALITAANTVVNLCHAA